MTDPLIGQSFGIYTIDRMIGRGSMGMVYHGVNTTTNRPVAIKTMSEDATDDEEMLQRFQREARVASEIDHPNVAHVFQTGKHQEMPYLVMEYIDGPTLADLIKDKGALPYQTCVDYVRQAARGLKAATEHGSLHRDIKPANLMITSYGELKIVDFGIARNHGGDSLRTAVGVVLGSPYYMSPEQSSAKPLDHRSDIYGLGATFYFLLTSRPPFEGRNLVEIIQKRARNDLRPINALNPNVPKRVADVVYKMMKTNPEERYQTYDELIHALDDALKAKAPSAAARSAPSAAGGSSPAPTGGSWLDFLEDDRVRYALIGAGAVIVLIVLYLLFF
ncbi:serine/threonine protein kinase [Candidatus Sumerlaeota bacterium]|nr:serine/threonine protein kinase [Candidatus Sumerlaeota bacterium]